MITTAFGKRIRELRETLGISQEKFALKIGMDRTYYSSVEAGKRNISIINICKIAKVFNITLSDLFDKIDYNEVDIYDWFYYWRIL